MLKIIRLRTPAFCTQATGIEDWLGCTMTLLYLFFIRTVLRNPWLFCWQILLANFASFCSRDSTFPTPYRRTYPTTPSSHSELTPQHTTTAFHIRLHRVYVPAGLKEWNGGARQNWPCMMYDRMMHQMRRNWTTLGDPKVSGLHVSFL